MCREKVFATSEWPVIERNVKKLKVINAINESFKVLRNMTDPTNE
tara:strand:- start:2571 stop:2705 length:135 start_codon:yes stop_codon:yes gene_type:complete